MGWAKYTEDNYKLYYERMDKIESFAPQSIISKTQEQSFKKDQSKNSFANIFEDKSCFSL